MRLLAEGIGAERGGTIVFSDASFELVDGGCLLVTGPNGAGKTTLLRVVAGLLPASHGRLRLAESPDPEHPDPASASHYFGHENAMKQGLSVTDNLAFWKGYLGGVGLDPMAALERLGLAGIAHLPFGCLSSGQKRRAASARLLVCHRPIWLLDEPTVGLDRGSEDEFLRLMLEHLSSGGMIIAATHLPIPVQGAVRLHLGESPNAMEEHAGSVRRELGSEQ